METAKLFKHSVSSFWGEILPQLTLRMKESNQDPLTRIVILTNFGSISREMRIIFRYRGL